MTKESGVRPSSEILQLRKDLGTAKKSQVEAERAYKTACEKFAKQQSKLNNLITAFTLITEASRMSDPDLGQIIATTADSIRPIVIQKDPSLTYVSTDFLNETSSVLDTFIQHTHAMHVLLMRLCPTDDPFDLTPDGSGSVSEETTYQITLKPELLETILSDSFELTSTMKSHAKIIEAHSRAARAIRVGNHPPVEVLNLLLNTAKMLGLNPEVGSALYKSLEELSCNISDDNLSSPLSIARMVQMLSR